MDERPSIDIDNLSCPVSLRKKRDSLFKKRLRKLHDKEEQKRMSHAVQIYRTLQHELLSKKEAQDPDPFVPSYIFYCFTGTLTE